MSKTSQPADPSAPGSHALRSACPVAGALDVVGDRWTLLVIRDLFRGKKRFGEFLASSEGIPTNILTERLKRLERWGLVETVPYSQHPPRVEYHLTEPGRELRPVVQAMATWGHSQFPTTRGMVGLPAEPGPRRAETDAAPTA